MVGIISLGGAQKAQAETTPTLGEKSAYTIKTGTETDYTYKTTDVDGVNSYHKIELKTPLSSSNSITWTEATSAGAYAISVQLPHNDDSANPEIKYYTYSYTKPSNYTTATGRVTDISTTGAVDKVLFQNLTSSDIGGAINNTTDNSNVNVTADFIGNYAADGGAIYNYGAIGDITGDFIGNYVSKEWSAPNIGGGAIYNIAYGDSTSSAIIGDITGDFIGNYAYSETIGQEVINDTATCASGGAISNRNYGGSAKIGNIKGNFIGNYASAYSARGGAIDNTGTIESITGNFTGNYANAEFGGVSGGAIVNANTIGDISGDFIGNYAIMTIAGDATGGAINNEEGFTIGSKDENGNVVGGIINSSFINNFAKTKAGTAQGGAIWTSNDLNIIAKDNYTSTFSGNYTESNGVKDDNAITVKVSTVNFDMKNGGKFLMNDNIKAINSMKDFYNETNYTSLDELAKPYGYNSLDKLIEDYGFGSVENFLKWTVGCGDSTINIKGDDINNTTFYLFNDIHNANVTFANTTINTINNDIHTYNFNKLTLNDNTNFVADVDLEAQTMDRFTADSYGQHAGNLNVVGMNLLTDAPEDRDVTEIYFAQQGLKDNVAYGGAELPHDNYQTTFYTPIYKYNAIYDNREDAGYFMFTKGDKIISGGGTSTPIVTPSGNPSDAFNPAVLGSSTSATVGAIGTMNTTMHYAFQNAENYMHIPYLERISHRDRNKYALSPTGDATDVGTFSPLFNKKDYGSAWVKPYATFENVALKNGPKVSNITYGTLIGFDTDIESIKNGWDRTFTGYIAYNGASQRYSGVDSYQNGGLIGGTMTLYKGNFFNATTLSVGANVASNSTMYGNDNYTMLLGGIGNKAGYNFEIKEGKLIFQPSMLVSYTWVNTFDYTNAAGVKIENDPLHAIQLAPGMKLIGNTKNGWQPYIGVSMVWNLMGKSDATANGVRLPAMSIKPYVQYGVGVQKRFKDHFMGFGQIMVHSGGRNGVSINGGFRWALGHDCNCQKVEGKGLFKFARKNKEVEAQPYDIMYRGNKQFGLYNRKVIKQMASVERVKAMK